MDDGGLRGDGARWLQGFDTCVVSDALDALDIRRGGQAIGLAALWEGARVCGRVMTVLLAEGSAPAGVKPVHLGVRAIQASVPGDVIVVDNAGRTSMGAWGGLLSAAAREHGVAGVIADGACRDLDEARALLFPVFGRCGACRTARGRVHEIATGVSVHIADVDVRPGDHVVADGSGVVFVPAERLDDVVAEALRLQVGEAGLASRISAGESLSSIFGPDYEHALRKDAE
jgi:regulator of RNase E activity RraA